MCIGASPEYSDDSFVSAELHHCNRKWAAQLLLTENEKAIITVDGTVIEIPVDDSTCEYIAETSVVNDAGVDWVRVDLYSVDENGTRAAIGFATYSWFVSNRTGGMDGYYTLIFQWKASLLLDRIYVTDYCLTTPTGKVVASGSPDILARGTCTWKSYCRDILERRWGRNNVHGYYAH